METKKTVGIGLMGAWHKYIYKFSNMMFKGFEKKRHWIYPCKYPECAAIAAWDENPARGQALADEYGVRFERDLEKFLADPGIDAVILCMPTTQHDELILKAVNAGKHIYVEKSPFSTEDGAYLAREAIRKNNIHFMVSSPMDKRRNRFAKELADAGKLGKITEVRFRLYDRWALDATEPVGILNKQENGGGALIDYGQHGIHILNWFLGMPLSCCARFGYVTEFAKKHQIEDNACVVYEFEDGALGIVETGWTAPDHECVLDVYGTNGRVHINGDLRFFKEDGERVIFDDVSYSIAGGNMIHIPEDDLPAPNLYPLRYWVDCIVNNTPVERQNIDEAVAWTKMLMAAYRAAESGECVSLR